MIIDASNLILGRMATFVAKKALLGEEVDVVNCENAVITGDKNLIVNKYMQRVRRGVPFRGPHFPSGEEAVVKRTIRGMLPHKQHKGLVALKRVKCYKGIPEQFKDKKAETVDFANISKSSMVKYITVDELCRLLRGNN